MIVSRHYKEQGFFT